LAGAAEARSREMADRESVARIILILGLRVTGGTDSLV
jgi:hypothetical protein